MELRSFLSFGEVPLANSFLSSPDEFAAEQVFPLELFFCPNCSLVQLRDVISPEILFSNYIYVTGTSETIASHNVRYAETVKHLLNLSQEDLVVEIASNDGSLLRCFKNLEVRTLGVEPATNIALKAQQDDIKTINQFFDLKLAKELRLKFGAATAVIANNVLAHVDDTRDFLRGCRELVAEQGLVIVEAPYAVDFVERLEYDTVYHEHLCYFSVNSLIRLFESAQLSITNIEYFPIHGGSIRIYSQRSEQPIVHATKVRGLAEKEREKGLHDFRRYEDFAIAVRKNRDSLRRLLQDLKARGKTVACYGAPAKGNTLLNYCRIDTALVSFTVDKNPMKVGLYTPGMHVPVLPVSALREQQPDYVLILAWNFAEEIIRQQQDYRNAGGKFIIPIPEPTIIE